MLFLLAVVVAYPCTVASRTAPPNCDPMALRPCAPIIWGEAPSAACCSKLREQKPCLCKYRNNQYLRFLTRGDTGHPLFSAEIRLRVISPDFGGGGQFAGGSTRNTCTQAMGKATGCSAISQWGRILEEIADSSPSRRGTTKD
ncbi:hypothetical protein PR202_gb05135 [Eleusine coracana subsp. coracana]|uniref:Bifunctional inhibitor/plant lipid transfer protein/seed storage helical domain-containing protein n=1 Tax=Eleusine coracana subsp. coracana TaxID=191504 RepID=A0AAV5E657_ELECO|nr:hypothetical protein PR202_gb05135 [Eleusine coracana subsp. coracana]